jgi:hypothetical protein
MARQLNHGGCRIGDQLFVSLDQHSGLGPPEAIIGQDLVDRALTEQLLERGPTLEHEREDHVSHVAIGVDCETFSGQKRTRKGPMPLMRLEYSPRTLSSASSVLVPTLPQGGVRLTRHISESLSVEVMLD